MATQAYNKLKARHPASRRALWQGGYTLFELMVVVAIIAFLAATVGPNFSGMVQRNQKAAALNDVFSMLSMRASFFASGL